MAERKFRLAYAPGARQLLTVLGLGSAVSGVLVTTESVQVRMGWGFRATIPRHAIAAVDPDDRTVIGIGIHGWQGVWLVNGSWTGLVRIQLDVGVRARVLGRPLPLTTLVVSVEDRDTLIRLIRPARPGRGARQVARPRRIRLPNPVLKPGLASHAHLRTGQAEAGAPARRETHAPGRAGAQVQPAGSPKRDSASCSIAPSTV